MKQPGNFKAGFVLVLLLQSIISCRGPAQCKEQIERGFQLDGFKDISASDNFVFYILPSKEFSVRAKGCTTDLSDLAFSISDSILNIRFKKYRPERYLIHFEVYTPVGSEVQFFKTPRVRTTVGPPES